LTSERRERSRSGKTSAPHSEIDLIGTSAANRTTPSVPGTLPTANPLPDAVDRAQTDAALEAVTVAAGLALSRWEAVRRHWHARTGGVIACFSRKRGPASTAFAVGTPCVAEPQSGRHCCHERAKRADQGHQRADHGHADSDGGLSCARDHSWATFTSGR
jgi:hypothetical protein